MLDGSAIQKGFEALSDSAPPLQEGRSLSDLVGGVRRQSWLDNQGRYFTLTAPTGGGQIRPLQRRLPYPR